MEILRLMMLWAAVAVMPMGAMAARGDIQPAITPAVIKPAEGIPMEPEPSPAPAALTQEPPESFDPSQFAALTTETLPLENGERVVMRVNDRPITWSDFTIQARMAGAALLEANPGEEDGVYAALMEPVMEALVVQELFREHAKKQRLEIHPSEVDRVTSEMISGRNPAVLRTLASLSDEEIKQVVTDSLTREKVTKFLGDMATSAPPTLEELASFADTIKPTTSPMELTRASHIVLRATPDMSEFNINDARARAEEVLQKIRGGLDFKTAARQYSQDRFTAYQDGNVGYYAPGQMYDAFEEAARKLAPGEVSDVVRTPVGFHIIQVTERHNDDLRLQWTTYKRSNALQEWLTRAAGEAKVERYLGK